MLHNPLVAIGKSKKLTISYTGPHKVIDVKPPCNYVILKNDKRLLIHANRLKLYKKHQTVQTSLCPQIVPPAKLPHRVTPRDKTQVTATTPHLRRQNSTSDQRQLRQTKARLQQGFYAKQ
jgi:hypothetical protein